MSRRYNKNRVKSNNIHVEFSDNNLTNYAGIVPISDFLMKKLGFAQRIKSGLSLQMGSNVTFQDYQIFSTIIYGYLCDYKRLAHFEELSKDRIIQKLIGLKKHLDENTLGNRLKKFSFKTANQFSEICRRLGNIVHRQYSFSEDTIKIVDLDSTVKGVYGNQEGAKKGFNPKKRGQKSYHPLMAFLTSTKECVHSWFRPGDTYTGNGVAEFMKECRERLPKGDFKYLFRADSGFFSDGFLSEAERLNSMYLVKVKLRNLRELLVKQQWEKIPGLPNISYCEFYHQCNGWLKGRKFVAIRTLKDVITEGYLFPQYIYEYQCFATNLEEAPIEIYHLYKDRAECENWIEAVKNQIGAGATIVNHFWANDVLWQLGVLAYNLTIWMRYLCCRKSWRQEPNTFRNWFIRVAGRLIYHSRQYKVKLQKCYYYRKDWLMIYDKIACMQL